MNEMKCFIAGLPNSGKSTYIAAFWDNLKREKLIRLNREVENSEYLDSLVDTWYGYQFMDRTPGVKEIDNLSLELKNSETMDVFELSMPDFKGEKFKKLLTGEDVSEFDKWCEDSNCLFFFSRALETDLYTESIISGEGVSDAPVNIDTFSENSIHINVQNIIILKRLSELGSFDKVVFFISAWDEIENRDELSAEDWLRINHSLLYSCLQTYFDNVKVLGISAQGSNYKGLDYAKQNKNTQEGKRAYIFDDHAIYDMTYPLTLLSE